MAADGSYLVSGGKRLFSRVWWLFTNAIMQCNVLMLGHICSYLVASGCGKWQVAVCALFVVFWWQVSFLLCLVALPYLLVAFGCFPMSGGGAGLLVAGASANPIVWREGKREIHFGEEKM